MYTNSDDGRDYKNAIIDRMNAAARARTRCPYSMPVKPEKVVGSAAGVSVGTINLGNRPTYSAVVMQGVYGLQMIGKTEEEISTLIGMPVGRVRNILTGKKPTMKEHRRLAAVMAKTEDQILRALQAE
ncbi:TPA: hypothetical protein MO340_004278 [Salmonella enterica subsp. salamae serovar 35:g,m,s,t:-]|nr:hypothetical protein [Salmonella enterica subsp. salamae serovar 35:g,m,s,t:-]HCA3549748.1 hypothetical protein [Salmonella enterica subsp. salamae serovar 35:g,m,s,t:-]